MKYRIVHRPYSVSREDMFFLEWKAYWFSKWNRMGIYPSIEIAKQELERIVSDYNAIKEAKTVYEIEV